MFKIAGKYLKTFGTDKTAPTYQHRQHRQHRQPRQRRQRRFARLCRVHPFERHIETGNLQANFAIVEQIVAGWRIDLRCAMYDFERMAHLAESRQRPDWAVALRTGRVGLMTE